ncbi:SDR family oxidoreductase [Sphingomonas sp. C8-2]|uniref:SDR family oxidoreductase n=1 Tax=Rhizorhabdus histidinilytica TaxID=439228 RepID=UPI000F7921D2|nr:SDR family oxidoreductase [Sphingomonas sp. C8-2]
MRVVVVTGCSSGIGLETALAFAAAGDKVVATVRDPMRASTLRAEAQARALDVMIEPLDVTQAATFAGFVDGVVGRHGRIDVLVNNAGMLPAGAFEDIDEAGLRLVMETNFFGAALLMKAVLPVMRRQERGTIVNISSLSGLAARAGDAAYSASKFALEGLTEAVSQEVARWNVRVALVEPGSCATNMLAGLAAWPVAEDSAYRPLVEAQRAAALSGADRQASPRTVADLIVRIAASRTDQLRWPADPLASSVLATLWRGDDGDRLRFLREAADVDWWISGEERPPRMSNESDAEERR